MNYEDLKQTIEVELQALGINLQNSFSTLKVLLFGILILGIIALVHFW